MDCVDRPKFTSDDPRVCIYCNKRTAVRGGRVGVDLLPWYAAIHMARASDHKKVMVRLGIRNDDFYDNIDHYSVSLSKLFRCFAMQQISFS
jgi:hypothetical protein